jgi:hypothetical protein
LLNWIATAHGTQQGGHSCDITATQAEHGTAISPLATINF